jgi:hypothetical protein
MAKTPGRNTFCCAVPPYAAVPVWLFGAGILGNSLQHSMRPKETMIKILHHPFAVISPDHRVALAFEILFSVPAWNSEWRLIAINR